MQAALHHPVLCCRLAFTVATFQRARLSSEIHVAIGKQSSKAMATGCGSARDWPAPQEAMQQAQRFIKAAAKGRTVLAPDRDADGLCAGVVACAGLC